MCCLFIVSRQWNDSHWVCYWEILQGKGGWHLLGDLLIGIYCNNTNKTENSSSSAWSKPYRSISGQHCVPVSKAQWICSTVQPRTILFHNSCTLNQDKGKGVLKWQVQWPWEGSGEEVIALVFPVYKAKHLTKSAAHHCWLATTPSGANVHPCSSGCRQPTKWRVYPTTSASQMGFLRHPALDIYTEWCQVAAAGDPANLVPRWRGALSLLPLFPFLSPSDFIPQHEYLKIVRKTSLHVICPNSH